MEELSSDRPTRTVTSEDDYLRCLGEFEEGTASVDIWINDSVAAATEAFEVVAIFATVAPYLGGDELSADQLQFRQSNEKTRVELRVENLFVEVALYDITFGRGDLGPLARKLAEATAAVAKSVLEVLSETE